MPEDIPIEPEDIPVEPEDDPIPPEDNPIDPIDPVDGSTNPIDGGEGGIGEENNGEDEPVEIPTLDELFENLVQLEDEIATALSALSNARIAKAELLQEIQSRVPDNYVIIPRSNEEVV